MVELSYINLEKKTNEWIDSLKRKTENTKKQYRRSLNVFLEYLKENNIDEVNEDVLIEYQQSMVNEVTRNQNIKPEIVNGKRPLTRFSTVNSRLKTLNRFIEYLGYPEYKVDLVDDSTENVNDETLSELDYLRLLEYCDILNKPKMKLIIETLAGTGIRISELEFFTVENVKKATRNKPKITVINKGKERDIIIPSKLRKSLLQYAKQNNITSGVIFRGKPLKDVNGELLRDKNGNLIYKLVDKAWIWRKLKYIAGQARVKKSKVHAHSFRHLFAIRYINEYKNLPELADLLGHESLETTRIYTAESSKAKQNKLDSLMK